MYVGERVKLRAFEPEDAERYRGWVNDAEIARLVDRATPVTPQQHRAWYEALTSSAANLVFAVERLQDHAFIGIVWLYAIHWRHRRAEVRIVLGDRSAWGGGHGTDALRLIRHVAFGPMNLDKLWADVLVTNPRGVAAFERAGFVREGLLAGDRVTDGCRVDVVRLGALRAAPDTRAR
jgi:RimJ/RimL family protein N-acetyltransferase